MNSLYTEPDEALNIDRILTALRDAPAPAGMSQRIADRLATAPSRPVHAARATRSWQLALGRLVPAHRYALGAFALLALAVFAFHHRSQSISQPNATSSLSHGPILPSMTDNPPDLRAGNLQLAERLSRGSRRLPRTAVLSTPASADPDTIALAESLAPSRPAPIMPLTAEEHLLLTATRQGQPIELAELDVLRQPALQAAAEAHQRSTIRNYIHSLLGPLAAVETINPTPPSPSLSDTQPAYEPPSTK